MSILKELQLSTAKLNQSLKMQLYLTRYDNFKSNIPRIQHLQFIPNTQNYHHIIDNFTNLMTTSIESDVITHTTHFYDHDSHIINTTLKNLRLNKDIIIKPADKNMGLCLLNPTDYEYICMKHLSDDSTYTHIELKDYNIHRLYAYLRRLLTNHGILWKPTNPLILTKLASSLLQLEKSDSLRTAPFYGTIKVHKSPISHQNRLIYPARPIAAAPFTATYHASKYLHNLLFPLVKLIPSICHSSISVIYDMHFTPPILTNDSVILTADVNALYPNIPIKQGIDAVIKTCLEFNYMLDKLTLIRDLLEWVLFNNYVTFNNKIYLQRTGTAMGTPVAPTFANLFLYQLEKPYLLQCIYYKRYIDDIFAIMKNEQESQQFVCNFNNVFPTIKLDATHIGSTGVFLDLYFTLENNMIKHRIYQKPENKYSYIPTISDHNKSVFTNFIKQELKRYLIGCTNEDDYLNIVSLFQQRLKDRGYSRDYLELTKLQQASRSSYLRDMLKSKNKIDAKPILTITIPTKGPVINWNKALMVPEDLLIIPEYKMAYPSLPTRVTLGRKHAKNIAKALVTNAYPQS